MKNKPVKYEVWTHESLDEEFETWEGVRKHFEMEFYYRYGKVEKLNPEYNSDLIKQGFTHVCDWYKGSEEYPDGNYCDEDYSLIKPVHVCEGAGEEDPEIGAQILSDRIYLDSV